MDRIFPPSPDGKISNAIGLTKLHVGKTDADGSRFDRTLIDNGAGELVDDGVVASVAKRSTTTAPEPGLEEVPNVPALVLEPVRIRDFVLLISSARDALRCLDRFIQLHDPGKNDVTTLYALQAALAPFLQPKA